MDTKKIMLVEQGHVGRIVMALAALKHEHVKLIVVDNAVSLQDTSFELNGKMYDLIDQKQSTWLGRYKNLVFQDPFTEKTNKLQNIDIIKEYGLIQLKKSDLSKSQRDIVVKEFEKTYKQITNYPKHIILK